MAKFIKPLHNQQIEHIAPRTPTDGSPLETGYELNEQGEYSEDFSSEYLNCLGNLMLISGVAQCVHRKQTICR
ncbi:TPA: DUF1524 domain-containing protein [Providencia rettgeri]|uniref:GmrSD restriction endonuclease domain-containing protein n=2 Tax=Gammaproteobacteria TaxID=1236 RepID=UPI002AB480BA|nr:DUF1524 domain-containing protein [Providencia rettgeri]HEM8141572.1 DUF1524 domain-containing protein [Providencia rettgeri]